MGNLFTSLLNSAGAMRVYGRQLAVIQNNVANANTPGYVLQTQTLEAMPFDMDRGLGGGVAAGPLVSSRSLYAEQTVRAQFSKYGTAKQTAGDLGQIGGIFDLTNGSGVSGSISSFFQSFSKLSVNPNDSLARQAVLDSAGGLTSAFQQASSTLANASRQADTQIGDSVNEINRLASQLARANTVYRQDFTNSNDAGLDAQVNSTLEQLAEYADFTATREPDGSYSIYLGGQTPLVIADREFQISASFSGSHTAILNAAGQDVSWQLQDGKLAAALKEKNTLISSYSSDLDSLASTLADQVNQQLRAGVDANGAVPTTDLFTYSAAGPASSIAVSALTPDQIAAATALAPGGNGNALSIADMLHAKLTNGRTFTESFGNLGARVGRDLSNATSDEQTQKGLLDQARSIREEISGVSLDQEAAHLMEVQRAYQASGKLMTVLNDVMDTLMQMVR